MSSAKFAFPESKEGLRERKNRVSVNTSLQNFIRESFGGSLTYQNFLWLSTCEREEIPSVLEMSGYYGVGNIEPINNIRRVNKFLENANSSLNNGQYFVICAETKDSRRIRILNKYHPFISRPYYILDFVLKRVFPKWKPTRKIYFNLTKGKNRVLSFTEILGRLASCGFQILDHQRVGYKTWFIAKKVDKPAYDMEPTYGALVCLRRVGKGGKLINVYKFRTMHPYSEYIQDYVFENNDLQESGKFNDDFRITSWGKWFRKLWIDELPMFLNFFKREMKLVGVRPLSRHYFSLYPEDLQELRTQVKPGLVPPYYADLPESFDEILESERQYVESYLKKPIRTDIKYFFKAMYNIFIKRARSA